MERIAQSLIKKGFRVTYLGCIGFMGTGIEVCDRWDIVYPDGGSLSSINSAELNYIANTLEEKQYA